MASFWYWGSYRIGFCERLLEASPVSGRANARRLQGRPATAQGLAHQQWWQYLCDNVFKKEKPLHNSILQQERGVRICERNNCADTKVSEGGAPGAGAEIPLQPLDKTMASQAVTLQPMEVHVEQTSTCSLWREDPTPEQVDAQMRLWPCGESALEQVYWQDLSTSEGPVMEQSVPEEEGPTLEQFVENCLPWRDPMLEQGKSVRRKEEQRQSVMN